MKNILYNNDRITTKDKKSIKGNYILNLIKYSLIFYKIRAKI